MALETLINENAEKVKGTLGKLLIGRGYSENLIEAMKYTALSGGKFIRPFLVTEFCRLNGGVDGDSLTLACAVEMIHAYSLIHDDLPCMDNSKIRRGRPSNHVINGEAGALLAGDGLLTKAFQVIADSPISAEARIDAVRELARYSGPDGMVGGQQLDCEQVTAGMAKIIAIHEGKTVALIQASCVLGVIAAGGTKSDKTIAREYGYNIGMAFQIVDDVLDVIGDKDILGKPTGTDTGNGKTTFVSLLGVDESIKLAKEYTEKAKAVLPDSEHGQILAQLADVLVSRVN
ncbi:MAG: polyprenyl synthetase family protein [Ruminococcaceae bacterium]|nr:polyprenyl synthetase family protein [Oscillospiraceae bacterium]